MTISLILGFLVVVLVGIVAYLRGRRVAAGVLALWVVAAVIAGTTFGREAVGGFMVGSLAGLPVIIGALVARDRRGRAS